MREKRGVGREEAVASVVRDAGNGSAAGEERCNGEKKNFAGDLRMSPHGTGYWCDAPGVPVDVKSGGVGGERSMAASVAGWRWECGLCGGGVGSGADVNQRACNP